MRKFLTAITISALLLTSCISQDTGPELPEETDVAIVGTLKGLGNTIVEDKSRHLFTDDNGEVYYVYSQFIDLDKSQYQDQRLYIKGQITDISDSGKEIIAIKSLTPLTSDFVLQDNKEEPVKKFKSKNFGFQLDHLKGWKIAEEPNVVQFTKDDLGFEAVFYENKTNLTLDEWLNVAQKTDRTPTLLGPDQLKSYMVEESMNDGSNLLRYYIARHSSYIYEFTLTYEDDSQKQEFSTIINSLRFIPFPGAGAVVDSATEDGYEDDGTEELKIVHEYISQHLDEFAPDYGGEDSYEILKYEFVTGDEKLVEDSPSYVYVTYMADQKKRILLSYKLEDELVSGLVLQAVFNEGSVTDWVLKDGEDVTKGLPFTVIKTESEDTPVSVSEGYRLFESTPFKFTIEYPSSWYVQSQNDVPSGWSHIGGKSYVFNDAPFNGSYIIFVSVIPKTIEDVITDGSIAYSLELFDTGSELKGYKADTELTADSHGITIHVGRDEAEQSYMLWGPKEHADLLLHMAQSIRD